MLTAAGSLLRSASVSFPAAADHRGKNADTLLSLHHLASKLVPRIEASDAGCVRLLACDLKDVAETVVVEAAHRREVSGEPFAVSCFQLLDEELNVGGDDFFGGLWLGGGGHGGDVAHGSWFLALNGSAVAALTDTPWPWPTPAGAASASGGFHPRSATEGERSEGLHKRSAEDEGAACGRQGRSPSGGLVSELARDARDCFPGGVAGCPRKGGDGEGGRAICRCASQAGEDLPLRSL